MLCGLYMKNTFIILCFLLGIPVTALASDSAPKYVDKEGYMCYVPEDCFGTFIPANSANRETYNGSYISPIMCAMLDLYNMHINPKHPNPEDPFDYPLIRGNSRESARDIVISLITENKDNAVNDSFQAHGRCSTPLFLAACIGDEELVKLILQKGGDRNMVVGEIKQGFNILQQLEKFSSSIRKILTNYNY